MASENVTFAAAYDHTFPSRAMAHYPAGWSGRVLGEIAERARSLGVLAEGDAFPTTRDELEKLAADEGVDVSAIEGTGARGHVKNEDIANAIMDKRAGTVGEIHHDETQPGAVIGSGGPSGAEAPTE